MNDKLYNEIFIKAEAEFKNYLTLFEENIIMYIMYSS